MDDTTKHQDPHRPMGGPGHETSDVNVWVISKFAIALVVITILSVGMLIGVFQFYLSRTDEPVAMDPTKVFPNPQLEQNEPKDLQEFRDREEKALTGYAWVDKEKGTVSIPIDQAIDQLVKKGLPVRKQAETAASNVSMPTESGLGQPAAAHEESK